MTVPKKKKKIGAYDREGIQPANPKKFIKEVIKSFKEGVSGKNF